MFITVSRSGKVITGSVNGKPFGVTYNEDRYKALKELEQKASAVATQEELTDLIAEFESAIKENYKEKAETICPYIFVESATGKFYLQLQGKILRNPMPKALVDRILKSIEDGIDFLPLIKVWIRFLRNPVWKKGEKAGMAKGKLLANYINRKYTDQSMLKNLVSDSGLSNEMAVEMSTRYQTPITQEGLLVTYKVSREKNEKWELDAEGNRKSVPRYAPTIDAETGLVTYATPSHVEDRTFEPAVMGEGGDEFTCESVDGTFTKGHLIKVGRRHFLDTWDQVNCQDGVFGDKGLHMGNLDYIRGYQNAGTVTHNVFLDPAMIGRFTDEGDGAVIAKEYFVYSSFAGVNRSIYHSSEYGKVTDAQYQLMLADSLKELGELAVTVEDTQVDANLIASVELD